MTKTTARFLFGLLAALAIPPTAKSETDLTWQETYDYTEFSGYNAAGEGVTITYELKIKTTPSPSCILTMEGYQTDETIICNAISKNNKLEIHFKNYPNGSVINKYGVAEYKPNTLLVTLRQSPQGLITIWGDLADNLNETTGKYFTRTQ